MKVMTQDEIKAVLEQHRLWLNNEGGSRANLAGADLSRAYLAGANLARANLDIAVCRMDFGGWSICIMPDKTSIGCQTHANADWLRWLPADVTGLAYGASEWWAMHGVAVKAAIRCVMAKHAAIEAAKVAK